MGGHRRLRLSSTKNYERKKRQKLSFLVSLPLQLYVETPATTLNSFNLLQVGAASLTFIPRYMHRMFEFRIGIVFIYTDMYPIPETFRLDIGKCMCHPYAQLFV